MSIGHPRIEVAPTVPLRTHDELSAAYTPGVAKDVRAIADDPAAASRITVGGNAVAIVTDGSAVLGLGDVGPQAALPVMEGKAALFKALAGIDAWPLALASRTVDDVVRTVRDVAPGFAGINLEDVAAPRCFEIERRLQAELEIPVFHDDQHGTAIAVLAALTNALRVVGKELTDVSAVISGAGAAGSAVARLLLEAGARRIVVTDSQGALHTGRSDLEGEKRWLAEHTNEGGRTGDLAAVLKGADVFVGVSAPGVIEGRDVATMADRAIVLGLANPDPEIDPAEARRHAAVVATGRSDQPNQINNALVFPGVFRGLIDAGLRDVSVPVQLAAARAIASRVSDDELSAEFIVPDVFDEGLVPAIARAVAESSP